MVKISPEERVDAELICLRAAVRGLSETTATAELAKNLGQIQDVHEQLGDLLQYLRGIGGNGKTESTAYRRAALGAAQRDRGK